MALADVISDNDQKNTDLKKGIALTQIGISSAEAIAKAVSAASDIPFPGNLAAIATSVGVVLANIKKAEDLLKSGGSSSAGGSGGGSSSAVRGQSTFVPPSLQRSSEETNKGNTSSNKKSDNVIRAYVTTADLTKSQNKATALSRRTSF